MTHYPAAVLVPADVAFRGEQAIEVFIETLLAPYSEHISVEPYKRYLPEHRVEGWYNWFHRVPRGDHKALFQAMQEDDRMGYADEIARGDLGLDECDFWEMSTSNPQGKWDYWSVYPYDDGLGGAVPVKDWPKDVILNRLVTEAEGWVEWGRPGWWGNWTEIMSRDEWIAKWNSLLEQHPDHCVVTLDCHT